MSLLWSLKVVCLKLMYSSYVKQHIVMCKYFCLAVCPMHSIFIKKLESEIAGK